MSTAVIAIELLRSSVRANDLEKTSFYLQKMPLEDMEDEKTDKLLIFLLNSAYLGNSDKAAVFLLNEWNKLTPDDDTSISIYTHLFSLIDIDDKVLTWLIPIMTTECFEFSISELINNDANTQLLPTYQRISDLYGPQTNEIYKKLYEYALNNDNSVASNFLKIMVVQTNDFQEVPDWVYDFEEDYNVIRKEYIYDYGEAKLPKSRDLLERIPNITFENFKLPNLNKSVDLLTDGLKSLGVSDLEVETSRELLKNKLENSTEEEKMGLLQPVLESADIFELKGNLELFRILGPTNPHYDADLTLDHICFKYGGCRMMTCTCFEYVDEDEPAEDWFTGGCQSCGLKLRSRAHAVRKPLHFGGFAGCFCSAQCIKDSIVLPDSLTFLMTDRIVNQLNTYKIQDRVENYEPEASDFADTGVQIAAADQTY
jgi:hypothetical protein